MIISKFSQYLLLLVIFFTLSRCASKKSIDEVNQKLKNCSMLLNEKNSNQEYSIGKVDSLLKINMLLETQNKLVANEMLSMQKSIQDKNATIHDLHEIYSELEYSKNEMESNYERGQQLINSLKEETFQQEQLFDSMISKGEVDPINYSLNEGRLAFHCPKQMDYLESYSVIGLIADVISNDEAKSILINKIVELDEAVDVNKLKNDSILVREINYYNLIELELDEASNKSFEIRKMHSSNKQKVNPSMEGWHWEVKPIDPEPNQKLVLKVFYYDENDVRNYSLSKAYNIKVKIRSYRFLTNLKTHFIENTEWAMGTIILPFLTFLFGRYDRNKKKKST
ncbi:MAG: hypothetical protein ABJM36_05990 [Algibacter sp.]|uniref:hypothetical protein n=1 Tax=Algibacter sp. TaxID=1872428 RepID=UPI003299D193